MLKHKNVEAPAALTVRASVSNKSSDGIIDMNIVHNNELTFQNINFSYMEMAGQIWLTASEVGQALEYADDKAIHRIFNRHADEFTSQMTGVVKVTTPGGMQDMRVFSLRGAHLIGMFARTPKAKEFRRWVLDVLDREVIAGNAPVKFDFQMYVHNANAACMHMEVISKTWHQELHPALRKMGSPLAGKLADRITDAAGIVFGICSAMERASGYSGLQYK
ncbi:BRO-N domain-containing protein [Citrobacter freundii]|uniref:BRO-N domain-containing protein n=2 Tax=Enterobacteriaceae TaxID=543 RepID=UPI001FFDEFFE|nr:Bro-N domain-containing protein [Citrobacter freundii]